MALHEKQKKPLKVGLILIGGSLALILVSVLAGPFMPFVVGAIFSALASGGSVYLAGVGYGVVNDALATGQSVDYFSKGHQPNFRAINSKDRAANTFAWGLVATSPLALIAGILFCITALIVNFVAVGAFSFFFPIMLMAIALTIVAADLFARYKKNQVLKSDNLDEVSALDEEQLANYLKLTRDQKAAWQSCSYRNGFGYIVMPIVAVAALITYIALEATGAIASLAFFAIPFPVQLALVAALLVFISASVLYTYCNSDDSVVSVNTQTEDQSEEAELEGDRCNALPCTKDTCSAAPVASTSSFLEGVASSISTEKHVLVGAVHPKAMKYPSKQGTFFNGWVRDAQIQTDSQQNTEELLISTRATQ